MTCPYASALILVEDIVTHDRPDNGPEDDTERFGFLGTAPATMDVAIRDGAPAAARRGALAQPSAPGLLGIGGNPEPARRPAQGRQGSR
jgi:hypothetical protein